MPAASSSSSSSSSGVGHTNPRAAASGRQTNRNSRWVSDYPDVCPDKFPHVAARRRRLSLGLTPNDTQVQDREEEENVARITPPNVEDHHQETPQHIEQQSASPSMQYDGAGQCSVVSSTMPQMSLPGAYRLGGQAE